MEGASSVASSRKFRENMFSTLPSELQRLLLTEYVGPEGTCSLSATCTYLQLVCSDDDVWKSFCSRELGVQTSSVSPPFTYPYVLPEIIHNASETLLQQNSSRERGPKTSFYHLYTRLLYPFRGVLNRLLTTSTTEYGEILTLSYKNGIVRGDVWFPPLDFTDTMKPVLDFTAFLDGETGDPVVLHEFASHEMNDVVFSDSTLHKYVHRVDATESEGGKGKASGVTFGFRRRSSNASTQSKLIVQWKTEKISYPQASDDAFVFAMHHLTLLRLDDFLRNVDEENACCRYVHHLQPSLRRRLDQIPETLPVGLFKGTYGAHGNEVIKMEITDWKSGLQGVKILGDPNVPAGEISFSFNIENAVVLTSEQQDNIEFLEQLHHSGPFQPFERGTVVNQPFKLPDAMVLRDPIAEALITDTCTFRFVGHGTIAGHGYNNPTSIIAHLIVFSPERFLVLWFGAFNFASLFEKISSQDRICQYF